MERIEFSCPYSSLAVAQSRHSFLLPVQIAGILKILAAGHHQLDELLIHAEVHLQRQREDEELGLVAVPLDEGLVGDKAHGNHIADAVGTFEGLSLHAAMLDDAPQELALGLTLLLGDLHHQVVDKARLGVNLQNQVAVEVGDVLDDIMNDGGLQQNAVDVAVVNQDAHGVQLVAEHIAAGMAPLSDEGGGYLHVGGKIDSLEMKHVLVFHLHTELLPRLRPWLPESDVAGQATSDKTNPYKLSI